jgi:putative ABC transport system permease protein
MLSGRAIESSDQEHAPRIAVVNQAFAQKCFGAVNPLGERFRLNCSAPWIKAVGVVANTKASTRLVVRPTVYLSYLQGGPLLRTLTVRINEDAAAVMPAVRQVMAGLDPDVPILDSMTP